MFFIDLHLLVKITVVPHSCFFCFITAVKTASLNLTKSCSHLFKSVTGLRSALLRYRTVVCIGYIKSGQYACSDTPP